LIVVDTNVIAYFVIAGSLSPLAEQVREKDAAWAAPRLWRSEMRNLLALYLRQKTFDLEEIKVYINDAEVLLSNREFEVDSADVLELASKSGCTSYDCEFVSVAKRLNVPLVTADKKVLTAFPSVALSMTDFAAS
jgi:predicted nucleic acid-binding protein